MFLKSSSIKSPVCSEVEGHWPRLKWEASEAWPQNRRGWENLRMFKPNRKRRKQNWNERCLGERPSTIKNRQPLLQSEGRRNAHLKKNKGEKKVTICRFQSGWWKLTCWSISHPRPNLISSLPLCTSALCPHCHLQPLNTTLLTVYWSTWPSHIFSLTWISCSDTPYSRLLSTVLPPLSPASDPQMLTIYNS